MAAKDKNKKGEIKWQQQLHGKLVLILMQEQRPLRPIGIL
jgi:hypothetical protein